MIFVWYVDIVKEEIESERIENGEEKRREKTFE